MAVLRRPAPGFLLAFITGVAAYVGLGVLTYVLFYNHFPPSSARAWFMLAYSLHLLSTVAVSYAGARLLHKQVVLWIAPAIVVIGLAALPTLGALSVANGCHGMDFPIPDMCPE